MSDETRPAPQRVRVGIYLTPDELATWQAAAARLDRSLSSFVRCFVRHQLTAEQATEPPEGEP